jgi:hypothetical protein
MKNIFNPADANELLQRVEKLTAESKPLWGKMNVAQMMAHCTYAAQMPTGEISPKAVGFPISVLGKIFKPKILGDMPMRKNSPTAAELIITDEREFQKEKANLVAALKKLAEGGEKIAIAEKHPFFGKMTANEWGRINYKHADHHLSQFGV